MNKHKTVIEKWSQVYRFFGDGGAYGPYADGRFVQTGQVLPVGVAPDLRDCQQGPRVRNPEAKDARLIDGVLEVFD